MIVIVMRKFKTVCVCLAVLVCVSCFSAPQSVDLDFVPGTAYPESNYPQEPMGGKTAFQYFKDEQILIGWNVGNTLDAYSNGAANETVWGNPRITQEFLDGVKAAGFDIVRIPVTWMGFIGPAPDNRIAPSILRRVGQVAEMARKADLKVIINLHHDGSTPSKTREDGWLSVSKAAKNTGDYYRITNQFLRVWQQIAVYFKNYGEWLMFEAFNELQDGGWGWSSQSEMNPQIAVLNEWTQFWTNVVRASGGNNETRYLVIPGYSTSARHTLADYFILPLDSVPDKQIVTFHYYDPYEFGILGDKKGGQADWGSDADRQKIDADFAPFKAKFIDNNIPVIIGESGAVRQLYPGDAAKEDRARQARLEYLSNVYAAAKNYGLVPFYWDNGVWTGSGEKFGLLSRSTGRPNSDESAAVINAMINAVK